MVAVTSESFTGEMPRKSISKNRAKRNGIRSTESLSGVSTLVQHGPMMSASNAISVQKFHRAAELHSAGRVADAMSAYRELEALLPSLSQFWHFYGLATLQSGDLGAAARRLCRALLLTPSDANCLNRFACIFLSGGRPESAQKQLRRALSISPTLAEACYNLGEAERSLGNRAAALACFERAVAAAPENTAWQVSVATLLNDLGRATEARAILEPLEQKGALSAELFFQMGRARFDFCEAEEAVAYYHRALLANPSAPEGYNNLQLVQRSVGRMTEGVRTAVHGRTLRPSDPVLEYNLGDALLAAGKISEGYLQYSWRHLKDEVRVDRRGLPQEWNGSPATGNAALLLCHEQGIGDEIRFASCVRDIRRLYGGRVILEADPRLVPLFQRSFDDVTVIEKIRRSAEKIAVADCGPLVARENIGAYLMLGDMPRLVRPNLDAFSPVPGFLLPAVSELELWLRRFKDAGQHRSVGFCWRSGLRRPGWRHNDLEARQLAPLFEAAEFLPVCLQYDECDDEIRELEKVTGKPVYKPLEIDQKNELDRVAGMIAALDLVVSANTSVLFIAGAVGTPAIGLHGSRTAVFLGARNNPWLASEISVVKGGNRTWDQVIPEAAALIQKALGGEKSI
ncbi:tetratricopeptide repeat protein [Nisaea acidiphila]|uniref:Tetratricopeptide repeat protein n=1 Tax=Nisaea acidiphila TaxID=1862145 RepID=A0A9J7AUJ5_9PROT|nr:tetratricopeptide repeat protein [Nisaea acidiphila]UUX50498.1 tetratricopeptide repeat protein [Nisaea acidiphila]